MNDSFVKDVFVCHNYIISSGLSYDVDCLNSLIIFNHLRSNLKKRNLIENQKFQSTTINRILSKWCLMNSCEFSNDKIIIPKDYLVIPRLSYLEKNKYSLSPAVVGKYRKCVEFFASNGVKIELDERERLIHVL